MTLTACSSNEEPKEKIVIKEVPVIIESKKEELNLTDEQISDLSVKELIAYMSQDEESFNKAIESLKEKLKDPKQLLKDGEAKKIAELLASYSGDSETKIYAVLGIQKDSINKNSLFALNEIFFDISGSGEEITESLEQVLIEYLSSTLIKYESKFKDAQDISETVKFFRDRLIKAEETDTISKAFKKYAVLTRILPGSSYKIFKNVFPELRISSWSTLAEHQAYNTLLKEFILNENKLDTNKHKNVVYSAKQNIRWANKLVKEKKLNPADYLDIISNYLSLFDLEQIVTKRNVFRNDINDIHFEVTKSIKSNLNKILLTNQFSYIKRLKIHPYIKILINRINILKKSQPIFDFESEENPEVSEAFHKEREMFSGIKSYKSASQKFMKDYYNVIVLKHSLELYTMKNGEVKNYDELASSIYKKLISSLHSALEYFYDKKFPLRNFYNPIVESKDLYQSISDEYEEIGTGIYKVSLCMGAVDKCPTKKLYPGVHSAPKGIKKFSKIQIFGAGLDMSPLAIFLTRGTDILFDLKSIDGLWIDSRGMNGDMKTLDETQLGYTLPEYKSLSKERIIKNQDRRKWRQWTVLHTEGTQLRPQPRSTDGKDAGKVEIHSGYGFKINIIPLINTSGGDGSDGAEGQSTRLKEYTEYLDIKSIGFDKNYRKYTKTMVVGLEESTCIESISLVTGSLVHKRKKEKMSGDKKFKTSKDISRKVYDFYRGKGGDAGNGGNASSFSLVGPNSEEYSHLFKNLISMPGKGGEGGEAGECGLGDELEYRGMDGIDGSFNE